MTLRYQSFPCLHFAVLCHTIASRIHYYTLLVIAERRLALTLRNFASPYRSMPSPILTTLYPCRASLRHTFTALVLSSPRLSHTQLNSTLLCYTKTVLRLASLRQYSARLCNAFTLLRYTHNF